MYRILTEGQKLQDGTSVMTFYGVARWFSETYEYDTTQDVIVFKNCSDNPMTLTIGGTPNTVKQGESYKAFNISAFTVASTTQMSNQFFTVDSRTDSIALEEGGTNPTQATYAYNADGSVQSITEKDAGSNVLSTTVFTYKANGDVDTSTKVVDGKSVITQYIYDVNGNLTDTVNTKA
jgi:hypothetical protein